MGGEMAKGGRCVISAACRSRDWRWSPDDSAHLGVLGVIDRTLLLGYSSASSTGTLMHDTLLWMGVNSHPQQQLDRLRTWTEKLVVLSPPSGLRFKIDGVLS
jgi:hypothetical protein